MIKASYHKYSLNFKIPGGTSRGILHQKNTYFLLLRSGESFGIGECGLFKGLSCDDRPDYEEKLQWVIDHIDRDEDWLIESLREYPSIQFGLEQAFLSLNSSKPFELFPSKFSKGEDGILINGLIWMGKESFMKEQVSKKLQEGFTTLKMKIGAIDFKAEMDILESLRKEFGPNELAIRVDANGAFAIDEVYGKLDVLADLDIHSIEQPISAGQHGIMAELCVSSPIPIALDEELIGVVRKEDKDALLTSIQPQFIILKPSLVGGFRGCREWISACEKLGIDWWITSALESNIGLNAIAQFTYTLDNKLPQGLGTGSLFTNNIKSPLFVKGGALFTDPDGKWEDPLIFLED